MIEKLYLQDGGSKRQNTVEDVYNSSVAKFSEDGVNFFNIPIT